MNNSTLWPFIEAQKIIDSGRIKDDKVAIFETGYGPSGLPHIGTFGEVIRTNWVKQAYEQLTNKKAHLISFSDDMDALRKTPSNIDNKELLDNSHGFSLSKVPNPFGTDDESFAHYNNRMLREFIDDMGVQYEFASSTEYYTSGRFNHGLKKIAINHDKIVDLVKSTLRENRAATWSPFMPIHPVTGKVMMTSISHVDPDKGIVIWNDDYEIYETSIYDGNCKIQWKVDWALRWYCLGVDYEMSGKDLIDSVKLSSKICKILGGVPPINLTYELFLDEQGKKISKSVGNGMTFEQWKDIGSINSLKLFMFNNPGRAKKIYPEVTLQMEEDYIKNNNSLFDENCDNTNNPVNFFIDKQNDAIPITYSMIINIVSASSATTKEEIWTYLKKYCSNINTSDSYINELIEKSINYYNERILPNKKYRSPSDIEKTAIKKLINVYENFDSMNEEETETRYQYWVFEIGKEFNFNLREWFKGLYEILLGQEAGPRFGVFVAGYGKENTIKLMKEKIGE